MDAPIVFSDGSRIVFPAADKNAIVNLWLRDLQSSSAQKIPGTTGANYPFWSADGRLIGFFANGKLMKVELSGGMTQALCDVSDERGGTWNQDGVILFSPHPLDGLYRISSAGGIPTQVTFLDPAAEESSHRFPYFLPDGKHFIFFVRRIRENPESISARWIRGKSHYCCLPTAQPSIHPDIFCFSAQAPCSRRPSTPGN